MTVTARMKMFGSHAADGVFVETGARHTAMRHVRQKKHARNTAGFSVKKTRVDFFGCEDAIGGSEVVSGRIIAQAGGDGPRVERPVGLCRRVFRRAETDFAVRMRGQVLEKNDVTLAGHRRNYGGCGRGIQNYYCSDGMNWRLLSMNCATTLLARRNLSATGTSL